MRIELLGSVEIVFKLSWSVGVRRLGFESER